MKRAQKVHFPIDPHIQLFSVSILWSVLLSGVNTQYHVDGALLLLNRLTAGNFEGDNGYFPNILNGNYYVLCKAYFIRQGNV